MLGMGPNQLGWRVYRPFVVFGLVHGLWNWLLVSIGMDERTSFLYAATLLGAATAVAIESVLRRREANSQEKVADPPESV